MCTSLPAVHDPRPSDKLWSPRCFAQSGDTLQDGREELQSPLLMVHGTTPLPNELNAEPKSTSRISVSSRTVSETEGSIVIPTPSP